MSPIHKAEEGESIIRKVIFSEVSYVVTIITLVVSFVYWVITPQRKMELELNTLQTQIETQEKLSSQIQNLKDNDLHALGLKYTELSNQVAATNETLAVIKALLQQHINSKL